MFQLTSLTVDGFISISFFNTLQVQVYFPSKVFLCVTTLTVWYESLYDKSRPCLLLKPLSQEYTSSGVGEEERSQRQERHWESGHVRIPLWSKVVQSSAQRCDFKDASFSHAVYERWMWPLWSWVEVFLHWLHFHLLYTDYGPVKTPLGINMVISSNTLPLFVGVYLPHWWDRFI